MKRILFFFLIGVAFVNAQYSTPGTGVVWNMDSLVANSGGVVTGAFPNYSVTAVCSVKVSDRLIIRRVLWLHSPPLQPDSKFSAQLKLTVRQTIRFTSKVRPTTRWAHTRAFISKNTNPDTSSVIKYASFVFGYYPVRCSNSSPRVYDSRFYKCRRPVYVQTTSHPVIQRNYIEEAYEYGIYVTTGSSPVIEYNELYNNNAQNTSPKNQISVGTQNDNSPRIRYNKIHGGSYNRTGGIGISAILSGSSSSSEIAFNEIYNNSFGITMGGGSITCYVHDNLIYNNNINPDPLTTGSGISITGAPSNTPIVSRNTIYGNLWGITVYKSSNIEPGPQPSIGNLTNVDTTDDGYNKIYGNHQSGVVYDLFNNCTNDIWAQNNDWGVYDSSAIELHITHKVDDPLRGWVFFNPFIDSSIIPVEFTSFRATANEKEVVLDWETATELNNAGFKVERLSKDLKNWDELAFINGKGTSTTPTSYSFTDKPAAPGSYTYRLRQIDYDGTHHFSNYVYAEFTGLPEVHGLSQNFPNPFNPETVIRYTVGGNEPAGVALRIYDMTGAEIATLLEETQQPGNYEVKFNPVSAGLSLSSGVYLYEITINTTTITKKLVINK